MACLVGRCQLTQFERVSSCNTCRGSHQYAGSGPGKVFHAQALASVHEVDPNIPAPAHLPSVGLSLCQSSAD